MTQNPDKQLLSLLYNKQFSSILQCIDYLFLCGYNLEEALSISKELFLDKIKLKIPIYTPLFETILLEALNDCVIMTSDTNGEVIFVKEDKIMFVQNFKTMTFVISYKMFDQLSKTRIDGVIPSVETINMSIKNIIRNTFNTNIDWYLMLVNYKDQRFGYVYKKRVIGLTI